LAVAMTIAAGWALEIKKIEKTGDASEYGQWF